MKLFNSDDTWLRPGKVGFARIPMQKIVKSLIAGASFIGFLDSVYLTQQHFVNNQGCSIVGGCDKVTGSVYATLGGLPIALLGAIFYFIIFALAVDYLINNRKKMIKNIFHLSIPAFLFSLWLVYLQLFTLEAVCFYCMISASMITIIFLGSWFVSRDKLKYSLSNEKNF